jgi:hypothetical protein
MKVAAAADESVALLMDGVLKGGRPRMVHEPATALWIY